MLPNMIRGYHLGRLIYSNSEKTVLVHEAVNRSKQRVAIKAVKVSSDAEAQLVKNEMELLTRVQGCSHVVQLLDYFWHDNIACLVLELASGDLMDEVVTGVDEKRAKELFQDMITGLHQLQDHGIAHMDLKCENFLRFRGGDQLKICDLGLSGSSGSNVCAMTTKKCGTRPYIAPEVFVQEQYDPQLADLWSLGICLFALVTGSFPFREASPSCRRFQQFSAGKRNYPPWNRLSSDVVDLLLQLLEPDPHKRASLLVIQHHPWLDQCPP